MCKFFPQKILVWMMLFVGVASPLASVHFPVEGKMRERVAFWKKVYTEITTKEAFIHDSEDLSIIYKKISLPKSARRRIIKRERKKIKNILHSIEKKKYSNLNKNEQKILSIVGKRKAGKLYRLSKNIRIQSGLKDRYYRGLIKSYAYLDHIRKIYRRYGLPEELVYLPHVESSFNYNAYSKVGAAGIWQFMRSTARTYGLKISRAVDERLDPLKSTEASAKFLRDNYRTLKRWPLALTAYNHGVHSIKRAVNKLKTRNINIIVEHYSGRRFGFASKNFYATFMATVEISQEPEKYFESFVPPKRFVFSELKLDRPYTINQIKKALNLSERTLRRYNPSIKRYRVPLPLHRGFVLHIPQTSRKTLKQYKLALQNTKFPETKKGQWHIVSRGENLHEISKMYGVDLNDILSANSIQNPSKIYPGYRLNIRGGKVQKKLVSAKKTLLSLESYDLDLKRHSKNVFVLRVESEETIGHYAFWADTTAQNIRKINNLHKKTPIYLGQKLRVKILPHEMKRFTRLRNGYHLSIQKNFFNSYSISDQETYSIKNGETLDQIIKKESLPFWLVRREQPRGILNHRVRKGQVITLPKIVPIEEES